jgi:hypothetical protein
MTDFSKDIQQFQRYGTYEYKFDNVGNLIFDSSSMDFSRVYLSLPIENVDYNNSKIESFFDTEFTEFVPASNDENVSTIDNESQVIITNLEEENVSLKNQLGILIDKSNVDDNDANKAAIKQVILELRILLGEGRVDSDFSEDFPYAAILKNT